MNTKVDTLDQKVEVLGIKHDQKVEGLDSKLELILKYLFEMQVAAPLELDHANHVDQLISHCLICTLEDVEACYKEKHGLSHVYCLHNA